LKIAVVSDIIYPWTKGGAELRYYEIYKRLAKRHEVHYFTMRYPGMQKKSFEYEGVNIHTVCKAPENLYKGGRRRIIPALDFSARALLKLRSEQFDIVDANNTPFFPIMALWLCKLMNPTLSIVSTWHEHWSLEYWHRYLGFLKGTIGFIVQQVCTQIPDGIISVSTPTESALQTIGKRNSGLLGVVWNGVDTETISLLRQSIKPNPRSLVFVGRLIPEKRVDMFINLVGNLEKIVPGVTAVIVGNGPERQRLEELAQGLDIRFVGFLDEHKDVLAEIARSWILVSFSEREGFNISALEACQIGLPTYVRLSYFDHVNQHLICKENTGMFVRLLKERTRNYSPIDQRYTWESIADQIERLLSRVIASRT